MLSFLFREHGHKGDKFFGHRERLEASGGQERVGVLLLGEVEDLADHDHEDVDVDQVYFAD